jgi:hypothetical protein
MEGLPCIIEDSVTAARTNNKKHTGKYITDNNEFSKSETETSACVRFEMHTVKNM